MWMRGLGRFVARHRSWVLIVALLLVPIGGVVGGGVAEHLSAGGFDVPGAESALAEEALETRFGTGPPNFLLLVTAREGTVDRTEVAGAGLAISEELAAEASVQGVVSYWTTLAAAMRSRDGTQALVLARIPGDLDEVKTAAMELAPRYVRDTGDMIVRVGGFGEVFHEISEQSERDLQKAELLSLPVTLALLVVVFGSAIAAGLPVGTGILAIVLTMVVLRLISSVTEVSIFALNLTTAMGLGLAIDYSLFVVSRFREELRAGASTEDALQRTMYTAGRTVAFSAFTVAISLAALALFPLQFLRSFAYAGVAVVAIAGAVAVVVLPAALAALGPRIDRWALFKPKQHPLEEGFWYRRARSVMRRPIVVTVVVGVALLTLALPFLRLDLGMPDDRVLPLTASSRFVHDQIRTNFDSNEAGALSVVVEGTGSDDSGALADFAMSLSRLDNVARVDAPSGFYVSGQLVLGPNSISERYSNGTSSWLSVVPSVEPLSIEGERLVEQVRSLPAPSEIIVGGSAARLVDTKDAIFAKLPLALAFIAVTTFVLLFLMVGSILVPLKALVLNLLSLTATFGALVWIFQEGHLASVLGFTATGSIAVFIPVSLFCIAFGLSMDYEVFLIARIKEHYDMHGDNDDAVAHGLQLSGRIVTAAALLLAIVFIAFTAAQVSLVKTFGVGLALAVLVDAFIVRATLVPALMKLAGRANWWAPRRLRRLHLRFGIWELEPINVLDTAQRATADKASRKAAARKPKPKAPTT